MRRNVPPSTCARVLTVSVLARPGTPSSRTWPPARRATSRRSSIASWPTITRLISCSAASSASRASSKRACCCARAPPATSSNSFILLPSLPRNSHEPPEPRQRHPGADQQQHERAAGEARRQLALALLRSQLRAEALVGTLELAGVVGGEALAARRPRDLSEAVGVGRDATGLGPARAARPRDLDRARRRAERDRVDRDLRALGLLRGRDGVLALR